MTEPTYETETAPDAPFLPPVQVIGGPSRLAAVVPLQWPVAVGDRQIHAIHVVRLTAGQVRGYLEGLLALPEAERNRVTNMPMFEGDDGLPVSPGVLDGLMDNDLAELERVAAGFMPARLPPAPDPRITFAEGGLPRQVAVPLKWPVVVDGVRLEAVVVRRLRVAEVRAYVAAVQAGQEASLPMFEHPDGTPLPRAVLDQLDTDDFDTLDARALDFLPLALRGDPISA